MFKEGAVTHIHFVAETKGSMSSMALRPLEKTKIECARKFFEELSRKLGTDDVKYDVELDYPGLMALLSPKAA